MKSLVESLFDSDLASKDTGMEYLYGVVDYIDYISGCSWVFPDWSPGAVDRMTKDLNDVFKVDAIERDYKKLSKKFHPKDWTEYEADPSGGYSYAIPFKGDPYRELIRKFIFIFLCSTPTVSVCKVYPSGTYVDDSKLLGQIRKFAKSYTRHDMHFSINSNSNMFQFTFCPEITETNIEHYAFFKIKFKVL